ncbi:hypothetical protein Rxycam_01722 [Rubrobacter xylanophilus DSM 9941]|uniref:hypothetical protein n=1 Tax=Rubrobacter xylanophilus TaxID=49319 RepID=UPI001C6415B0|nr:hypothetical protein [Rubrobacter xylanophilus]QYJ15893.1 hypothetical protein Rxycam_01722 [Rubrobacter xylanophilus DSM 9941]
MLRAYILPIIVAELALFLVGRSVLPDERMLPAALAVLVVVPALVFAARRWTGSLSYRMRRLSPEQIISHRPLPEDRERTPEELADSIVERTGEIRRALAEAPSEVRVEMCAMGYRACANDMITLTHRINEELKTAGPVRKMRLRRARNRAIEALSATRESLPPGALRTTRQEHQ